MSPSPEHLRADLALTLRDSYTIERELGAGGMATVYLAHDVKHDRKVAVKVLRPELAAVIGAERFLAEIKTTANLQHPHILPLFDSGVAHVSHPDPREGSQSFLYYVMPYVEGISLRDRLTREKQLPIADAVRIATEVASALDYAHRHGVIHRDIKPENIMLHDGSALVADFGIALAASKAGSRMTETGMSLGTPQYMSPEQAMGERDLDARSDVYALGCVTYEMLTGEPPFTGPTAQAIVAKVMTVEPIAATSLRKTIPPEVADAVHCALQKLPADRFSSAADFAASLSDPTRLTGISTRATKRATPMRRLGHVLPLTLAGIAIGALGMFLLRVGKKSPSAAREVRFTIPTPGSGDAYASQAGLAIAPDGSFFVYTAARNGVTALYRRDLDNPEPSKLPGTDNATWPAVSPDGQSLAFVAGDGNLSVMRFDGSGPRALRPVPNPPIGISWSRDNALFLGMLAYSRTAGLSRLALAGDTAIHQITLVGDSARDMHHFPYVLDSAGIVLFEADVTGGPLLGVAPLSGSPMKTLNLPLDRVIGDADGILVYEDPSDHLMAVRFDANHEKLLGSPIAVDGTPGAIGVATMAANGTMVMRFRPSKQQVMLVDETGQGKPLILDTIGRAIVRFSPDGKTAALAVSDGADPRIELIDLASGTRSTIAHTRSTDVEWMPNGRQLLTVDGPDRQAVLRSIDGSSPATGLASLHRHQIITAAPSPDGRSVVLGTVFDSGGENVLTSPLDSVATLTPFAASAANEFAARFSPDGHWIAYVSNESGRSEIYVRPFPGPGTPMQVSTGGGGEPVWSHDGVRLYYRTGQSLMAVQVLRNSDGTLKITGQHQIFTADFDGNPDAITADYDVAPDGKHFLIFRPIDSGPAEIAVWIHWMDKIKARLAAQHD